MLIVLTSLCRPLCSIRNFFKKCWDFIAAKQSGIPKFYTFFRILENCDMSYIIRHRFISQRVPIWEVCNGKTSWTLTQKKKFCYVYVRMYVEIVVSRYTYGLHYFLCCTMVMFFVKPFFYSKIIEPWQWKSVQGQTRMNPYDKKGYGGCGPIGGHMPTQKCPS